MMPSICDAWSVIGNKKVVSSLRCTVKAETSTPLALNAAVALSVAAGMAGKTTPFSPTMFWQSGEPRYSTHFAAAGLLSDPTQIESARPLNMLARLPLGPIGVGATSVLMPL